MTQYKECQLEDTSAFYSKQSKRIPRVLSYLRPIPNFSNLTLIRSSTLKEVIKSSHLLQFDEGVKLEDCL